jgi:hypothetical protein
MDTTQAFRSLGTLHEESNCEDYDYHYHGGFNYCCQRHWSSPLFLRAELNSVRLAPVQLSKAGRQHGSFGYPRDVNKGHTNTESIAKVTTSAGLTSLASRCRAKGASQTFGRYGKNGVCFCHHPVLVGTLTRSAAVNRRSRWGSVRCRPVTSSHFSFGGAPQVGQRTAIICVFSSEDSAPNPRDKNGQS